MKSFEYIDIHSVQEAIQALPLNASMEEPRRKVMLKAGGIDLLDQMKERLIEPQRLINLKGAQESMRFILGEERVIRIGAMTTLAEVAASPLVREFYPALTAAAASAATPQIRNVATIGGNLCQRPHCWYFRNKEFDCLKKGGGVCFAQEGDNQYHAVFGQGPSYFVHPSSVATPLVAAEAEFVVRGPDGDRTIVAENFFVAPDISPMRENVLQAADVLIEIRIPAWIKHSAHYEVRERQSHDWPLVAASVAFGAEGWKVILGAVAPIPWRARKSEQVLGARAVSPALAYEAASVAIDGANPLHHNHYKLDLIRVCVQRALLMAAGMEAPV